MLAWDNVRFLDRQRHRPSRRRWSLALRERAEYCANWSPDLISDRTAKKPKVTSRLTRVRKSYCSSKLTVSCGHWRFSLSGTV